MDRYRPFQKYSSITGTTPGLFGRPGGRPVGVRDGMGTRPNVPSNPMLGGLRTSPVPLPGMGGGAGLQSPREPLTMPTPMPMPILGGLGGQLQTPGSFQPPNAQQPTQQRAQPSAQQNAQNILNKYGMSQKPGMFRSMRGGY